MSQFPSILNTCSLYFCSHLRRLVVSKHPRGRALLLPAVTRPNWGPAACGTLLWGSNAFVTVIIPGTITYYKIENGQLRLSIRLLNEEYLMAWRKLLSWSSPPTRKLNRHLL